METVKLLLIGLVTLWTITGCVALNCYVCNTADVTNENLQICDDQFTASRGARIESGCAACTKERTVHSGIMFIKRECERSLRWVSDIWTCDPKANVFGLPGIKCVCTEDFCNSAPSLTWGLVTAIPMFIKLIL